MIQEKILVVLLKSKQQPLKTAEVLSNAEIALSTWSSEQRKLGAMKLIDKKMVRVIINNHVSLRMNYSLTEKGRLIAVNLRNISELLKDDSSKVSFQPKITDTSFENPSSETIWRFDDELKETVNECVEIGLDSFGLSLTKLVKKALEVECGIQWENLSENLSGFKRVLIDYFGLEASKKIEKVIAANLRIRFHLDHLESDDLSVLIPESLHDGYPSREEENSNVKKMSEEGEGVN